MGPHMTRRAALAAVLGGGAAVATGNAVAAGRLFDWPLGVQLWTVKEELARDFDGSLRTLGKLGYQRVESAGWHGRTPEAFRRSVDAAGLRCDAAHVSMGELHADPAGHIARVRDVGCDYLVCSSPLPSRPLEGGNWATALARAMTLDAWKRNAVLMNEIAAKAKSAGLRFGYHNHSAEFGLYDGVAGYDVLLRETDPALVVMELDVCWATAGGRDPAALLRAHPTRFALLHLKDLKVRPKPGEPVTDETTTEVGQGVVDWKAVLTAAKAVGVRGGYVEQEAPFVRPVFESLAMSRDYLRSL
jgi:sugar phosphate isomerase/epimerase